MFGMQIWDFG
jgi:hypothetical protein